ncbi:FAD-binding oxidoreductase [Halorubrum sp. SD626R]|jgi:sarcosine oxidase subunit beta|uniref:NAD(P)/FAD-dependent oxidoreductase n=1 Tax=Halorubrum sp. SD626R TaxID=1419722 RepID=UPI000ACE9F33|nr:FAD-dependent oxidoreductase [Halorubrum sp. SD626R]TKX81233.1 FAD-binding oxidoreductase [Halorubrum sp. SD626R]
MDTLVVGGGVVGLAAAYSLADRGANVTLVEKGSLGAGSTTRSAGGIRSQFSTRVNVELSLASKAVWNTFEERFGVDIGLRKNGYLFVARSEETAAQFRENVAMQRELGAESELLAPAEATEHCPGLNPDPFVAATYNPTDGIADPNLALQGYAEAARELGVDIRTKTAVTTLHREGDRVVGAELRAVDAEGSERHAVDCVVNSAGAWAPTVAAMAGVDLPISPRRRQIAVVEPSSPVPESVPLTIDLETGSYFRPEREGLALVGGQFDEIADPDQDPDAYDEGMDIEWAAQAVENAGAYTEYFGLDTRIKRGWAGLYAVTLDRHPIVEESIPGLVTVAGFSGHGFQHAPASGQIVADLIVDGGTDLIDISPLSRDRFENGETISEQSVA